VDVGANIDEEVQVTLDGLEHYDQIIVQGQPMVVCFSAAGKTTLDDSSDDIQKSWAQLAPAWPAADLALWKAASAATRTLPRYDRVLRRFKLVKPGATETGSGEFNWRAWHAAGAYLHPNVFVDGTNSFDPSTGSNSPYGDVGIRFQKDLPLTHQADVVFESLDVHFERPMALVRQMKEWGTSEPGPTPSDIWYLAHKPPSPPEDYDPSGPNPPPRPDVSARVAVSDRDMEIDINFVQGAQALGYGDLSESDVKGDPVPAFDWRSMIITVSVETDYRPSVIATVVGATGGQRKLLLRVPDAQYWVAMPNTIHGISEQGTPLIYNGPYANKHDGPGTLYEYGVLRSDMNRLVDIAALARVWYGRLRARMELTRVGVLDIYPLGTWVRSLIQDLGRVDVGTVVTTREFRFEEQRTKVTSGMFTIDPRL
jgi:hypothetical protein